MDNKAVLEAEFAVAANTNRDASFIDCLFAMTGPDRRDDDPLERAAAAAGQLRLARALRDAIEGRTAGPQISRDAA